MRSIGKYTKRRTEREAAAMRKKSNSEMKRLIAYIFGHNKREMPLVIVCLFFAAVASSASGVFLFLIIENVITPAISDGFSSVSSVLNALIAAMVVVYGVGVSASWIYARIMAKVGQRTLNRLRKDMFARMETLPISTETSTATLCPTIQTISTR